MAASTCASELRESDPAKVRELMLALVPRILVGEDRLNIDANPMALIARAGLRGFDTVPRVSLTREFQLVRRSKEVRLAIAPKHSSDTRVDPALVKLLVKAHAARQAFASIWRAQCG